MNTNLGITPWDSDTPRRALISLCICLVRATHMERGFLRSQAEATNPEAKPASRGPEGKDERVSEIGAWSLGDWRGKSQLSSQ